MRGRKYPVLLSYREIVDLSRYAAGLKAMPSDLKKITATATRTPSWFLKTFYRKRGKADKQCVQSDITALFITAAKRRVTGCFYFFRLGAFFCRLAALTRLGARTENASTARHCSRIPYDNVPVYLRGDCFYCLCPDTHAEIAFCCFLPTTCAGIAFVACAQPLTRGLLVIKQIEARFAERTARILARGLLLLLASDSDNRLFEK